MTNLIKVGLKISGFKMLNAKTLYAFSSFYNLKTLITKILPT